MVVVFFFLRRTKYKFILDMKICVNFENWVIVLHLWGKFCDKGIVEKHKHKFVNWIIPNCKMHINFNQLWNVYSYFIHLFIYLFALKTFKIIFLRENKSKWMECFIYLYIYLYIHLFMNIFHMLFSHTVYVLRIITQSFTIFHVIILKICFTCTCKVLIVTVHYLISRVTR